MTRTLTLLASRLRLQVFPDLLAKLKLLENMNDITENGRTRPELVGLN